MSEHQKFIEKYGPWALVTGTTSGIGEAFATALAAMGMNLVLVARRETLLKEKASALAQTYGVLTKTLCLDLALPDSTDRVLQETDGLEIGLVILNAALEFHGEFLDRDREEHQHLLQVNVVSPMQLTRVFAEKMVQQGRGGIVLVSSMGGYSPQPYIAHYGASKAYLSSLGEALHHELKPRGVDITVLAAGLTDTPMGAAYRGMDMKLMSPDKVAHAGLNALGKTALVVPGQMNKLIFFFMGRFLPRKLAPVMTAAILKRKVL
jgi:short-subunit dehydrogenase